MWAAAGTALRSTQDALRLSAGMPDMLSQALLSCPAQKWRTK